MRVLRVGQEVANWWQGILDFFQTLRRREKLLVHPTFASTFIQYWFCQHWARERWLQEFEMLKKVGIQEIIIQSVADTKSQYAAYPTQIKGFSVNPTDMLETALAVADKKGMKVRIGLGFNDEWWSIDPYDPVWLEEEAEINRVIATEIGMMYGEHPSFAGWYIPHEFNPLMAMTVDQQTNLNRFYQKIAGSLKIDSHYTIMVAPFYNARLSEPVTMTLWHHMLQHVFHDTGIGIIALQDSVGAGFNQIMDLDEIYAATHEAAKEMGMKLYAVTETFKKNEENGKKNESKFVPAPQQRIEKQFTKVAPYVESFVAFSINHYQNGNDPEQAKGYEDYARYYQGKAEKGF